MTTTRSGPLPTDPWRLAGPSPLFCDNLRFYQRRGFRFRAVERDAFTEATGYPAGIVIDGIELRDRVWLDLALPAAGA
ncbi:MULTISPECIES: hypothetical protein [unclassified Frankia]|uniref:hypothetical protein n=1 Tax=unclassified Frankia TaxID=2632575 RepID=UPI001933FA37|nr:MULTISPECIES: hypothetical protein [unclassified Frankia]MBL7618776.1 hypothetical protein [Frankia sp. AgB1.8]